MAGFPKLLGSCFGNSRRTRLRRYPLSHCVLGWSRRRNCGCTLCNPTLGSTNLAGGRLVCDRVIKSTLFSLREYPVQSSAWAGIFPHAQLCSRGPANAARPIPANLTMRTHPRAGGQFRGVLKTVNFLATRPVSKRSTSYPSIGLTLLFLRL